MDRYNFCVAKLFALFWDWSWPLKENGFFCRDLKLGLAKVAHKYSCLLTLSRVSVKRGL